MRLQTSKTLKISD